MNKLRIIVTILLGWLFTNTSFAQEVLYSPYERFDLRSGDFSVVGMINDRIYTYRASGDGYFLDIYNDSMDKVATVMLDFFPSKIYETRFIAYPDKIIVLYQGVEGSKVTQYAALLDDRGRLLKKQMALTSVKTGFFGPTKTYFSSVVSEDKKSIMVYSLNGKSNDLSLEGILIDDQLNIVRKPHASFHSDNSVEYGDPVLANNRSFNLPVYSPVGNKGYADQFWVVTLDSNAKQFTAAEYPLNNMFVANSFLKVDNVNDRVYIGGFYSDKKNGNYNGVMFGYYDFKSRSIQNNKMPAFNQQLAYETGERNSKKAFNNYQVRQLIVRNDGGFVLLSEDYTLTIRNASYSPGWGYYSMYYYGPYTMPSIREYHYGDILALSYSPEGNNEWRAFVRKDQYSQEDGGIFSSYAMVNTGGALGFLFNDYNTNRSRISLATVDGKGQVDVRSMKTNGNDEPDWLPRSAKQVAARTVVIPCLRKKQICFAKVAF